MLSCLETMSPPFIDHSDKSNLRIDGIEFTKMPNIPRRNRTVCIFHCLREFLIKYLKYSLNKVKQTSQKKIDRFREVLQQFIFTSVSILLSLIDLKSVNPLIAIDFLLSALTDVQYVKFLRFEFYTKLKILCE